MKIFGIIEKDTTELVYVGLHSDERSAWSIFLGWPGEDEVRDARLKFVCDELDVYMTNLRLMPKSEKQK